MQLKKIKITRSELPAGQGVKMTDFIRGIKPVDAPGLTEADYNEAKFECADAAELDNATQTAYAVREEKREDGCKYKVSRSTKQMRVLVSLIKP